MWWCTSLWYSTPAGAWIITTRRNLFQVQCLGSSTLMRAGFTKSRPWCVRKLPSHAQVFLASFTTNTPALGSFDGHLVQTNHIVECVVPFFVFMPRNWRVACGVIQVRLKNQVCARTVQTLAKWLCNKTFFRASQIGFQIVLIVSGNLSFLNWLSILPSLWCLDDAFFHSIGWVSKHNMMAIVHHGDDDEKTTRGFLAALSRTVRVVTSFSLLIGLTYLSIPVVANLLQLHGRQAMNTNYNNFKLLNTYGVRLAVQWTLIPISPSALCHASTYSRNDSAAFPWL